MAASDQVFRFAAGEPAARRSAVYRVWAPAPRHGKSDVYFAMRRMGEEFKVSLHGTRDDLLSRGHLAVSRETKSKMGLHERFLYTWDRPGTGRHDPPDFQLVLLESELRLEPPIEDDFSGVHWLSPPPSGGALVMSLLISSAAESKAREAARDKSSTLLSQFELGDGGTCRITLHELRRVPEALRDQIRNEKLRLRSASPDFRVGDASFEDPTVRAIIGVRGRDRGPPSAWIEVDMTT